VDRKKKNRKGGKYRSRQAAAKRARRRWIFCKNEIYNYELCLNPGRDFGRRKRVWSSTEEFEKRCSVASEREGEMERGPEFVGNGGPFVRDFKRWRMREGKITRQGETQGKELKDAHYFNRVQQAFQLLSVNGKKDREG